MGLSIAYGTNSSDEDHTADLYGDNEDLVGKWFARSGKRDSIFLATKFGCKFNWETQAMSLYSDPAYVHEACARSLACLGVSHIDLYYCHRVDGVTPIENTVEAMVQLKNEGKIRYPGLSEVSAETLRRACKVHPIAAVQIEHGPSTTDIEDPQIALLQPCRELGVAVVAYSPLGRGFLTGAYKSPADFEEGDFRKVAPRFSAENFPNNLNLVEKIQAVAERKACTVGQVTLAWLMAHHPNSFANFQRNSAVRRRLNILRRTLRRSISTDEKDEVRNAMAAAEVRGTRYPNREFAICV
ncbi:aldo-keto reductase, putative [Sphaerosporella brunnea]|uniref:Aldo-keto reductase, putative n=1 Tax=Sphaerosporella brunnea TaxID=1250544 RepID=A0A5J5EER0_9PEZI|nr:aldo-keto reductase, putative [Sphaerosporella brunnea]